MIIDKIQFNARCCEAEVNINTPRGWGGKFNIAYFFYDLLNDQKRKSVNLNSPI